MEKIVAIYVRVSTEKQELQNQTQDLILYSKRQSWNIHKVYSDIVSGKEIRKTKRPGFSDLFRDAHKKLFDVVLFWDLSRFSRSGTLYTLQKLQELKINGIDWVSYQEPYISTLGPFSDIVVSIMATLAKIEREKISERTKSGVHRARLQGKKVGRPTYKPEFREKVRSLLSQGCGIRDTARKAKVSTPFVYKIINDCKPDAENNNSDEQTLWQNLVSEKGVSKNRFPRSGKSQ